MSDQLDSTVRGLRLIAEAEELDDQTRTLAADARQIILFIDWDQVPEFLADHVAERLEDDLRELGNRLEEQGYGEIGNVECYVDEEDELVLKLDLSVSV